jgi:uncharacterized protein YbbC (DUF1343 family)
MIKIKRKTFRLLNQSKPLLVFAGVLVGIFFSFTNSFSQIITGAEQTNLYFPLLQGKRLAVVANQTSVIGKIHLVDTLLACGMNIQLVFGPEHGFRGNADAGEQIESTIDPKSGLKVISLYGKHKKPTSDDLAGIDMVIFDIQDVGVRFYTYISTLHYVMEACTENKIPLLLLDRPNPNGFYVDGPILDTEARSFVGMHPVPLVHGMTIAEYALMINGEGWLKDHTCCDLLVVPCKNYSHKITYPLPIKPSPNLPTYRSVLLYPSLGLFEGTMMSLGRGTTFPFEVFGHPDFTKGPFSFTPKSMEGAQYPPLKDKLCKGYDLRQINTDSLVQHPGIELKWLIESYQALKTNPDFFNNFFYRLAGTKLLRQQIEQGMTEDQIKASWQPGLEQFKKVRKRYLLYGDFE